MAVTRTTMFRPDCGSCDDGRGSRRCHPRTGTRIGGYRASKGSFGVESGSVAAKRGGSGKFLLVGAVLAIQFVGAAAISSKAGSDIKVDFKMPEEAVKGSSIDLKCEWRILSGSYLYSVKWYKDDHEFFRFLPESSQTQIFPRPGVKVEDSTSSLNEANRDKVVLRHSTAAKANRTIKMEISLCECTHLREGTNFRTRFSTRRILETRLENKPRSNSEKKSSIRLKDLILESSGQYKCEVSTEAPSFATTYQTANLTVIVLPEGKPEITGLSQNYAVGENVTATCITWPSVPKANLHWTINDDPVPHENIVQLQPMTPTNSQGIPNSLGLRLEAEHQHFVSDGKLIKIKCIAEVGSHKYETERTVQIAYVNNQRLSAGDHMHASARNIRTDLLAKLLTAILALVLLTT